MLLFFIAQIIGLNVINNYLPYNEQGEIQYTEEGEIIWEEVPAVAGVAIERPNLTPTQAIFYIVAAILVGSLLIFLIIMFRGVLIWKIWFALAIILCLYIAFAAFFAPLIAAIIAVFLGGAKVFFPNKYMHNLSELFTYGGLAALFAPLLTVLTAFLLLLVLSVYDLYAVFKSKHMIALAQFQTKSGVFAGLLIPYTGKAEKKGKGTIAVLGGGDIGFPLLFSGAVLAAKGFNPAVIVSIGATLGLLVLLLLGQKGKFYPAIPFLTAGVSIGYLITLLL